MQQYQVKHELASATVSLLLSKYIYILCTIAKYFYLHKYSNKLELKQQSNTSLKGTKNLFPSDLGTLAIIKFSYTLNYT